MSALAYKNSSTSALEESQGASGAINVCNVAVEPGQDSVFDRTFGGAKCVASAIQTADALIASGACLLYGYTVHVATATAVITIEDGITAGTGATKTTIPASKAVGEYALPVAIYCPTGIFLNYAASATGSVAVLYLPAAG